MNISKIVTKVTKNKHKYMDSYPFLVPAVQIPWLLFWKTRQNAILKKSITKSTVWWSLGCTSDLKAPSQSIQLYQTACILETPLLLLSLPIICRAKGSLSACPVNSAYREEREHRQGNVHPPITHPSLHPPPHPCPQYLMLSTCLGFGTAEVII